MSFSLFDALFTHSAAMDPMRHAMASSWDFRSVMRARRVCRRWALFVDGVIAAPAFQARLLAAATAFRVMASRGYQLPGARHVDTPLDLFRFLVWHDLDGIRAHHARGGNPAFVAGLIEPLDCQLAVGGIGQNPRGSTSGASGRSSGDQPRASGARESGSLGAFGSELCCRMMVARMWSLLSRDESGAFEARFNAWRDEMQSVRDRLGGIWIKNPPDVAGILGPPAQ